MPMTNPPPPPSLPAAIAAALLRSYRILKEIGVTKISQSDAALLSTVLIHTGLSDGDAKTVLEAAFKIVKDTLKTRNDQTEAGAVISIASLLYQRLIDDQRVDQEKHREAAFKKALAPERLTEMARKLIEFDGDEAVLERMICDVVGDLEAVGFTLTAEQRDEVKRIVRNLAADIEAQASVPATPPPVLTLVPPVEPEPAEEAAPADPVDAAPDEAPAAPVEAPATDPTPVAAEPKSRKPRK